MSHNSRPTPSKAVREALIDYSRERRRSRSTSRERERSRRRQRSRSKDRVETISFTQHEHEHHHHKHEQFDSEPHHHTTTLSESDHVYVHIEVPIETPMESSALLEQESHPHPSESHGEKGHHEIEVESGGADTNQETPPQLEPSPSPAVNVGVVERKSPRTLCARIRDLLTCKQNQGSKNKGKPVGIGKQGGKRKEVEVIAPIQDSLNGINSIESVPDPSNVLMIKTDSTDSTHDDENKNENLASESSLEEKAHESAASSTVTVEKLNSQEEENAALSVSSTIPDLPKQECCFCASVPQYHIEADLKDQRSSGQTRFIQKTFAVLCFKTLAVLGWMYLTKDFPLIQDFYDIEGPVHYHFISGGIYIFLKLAMRVIPSLRKKHWILYVLLLAVEIIVASDFLAYLFDHWLTGYFEQASDVMECLVGTMGFFAVLGIFATYEMRDGIMLGCALITTFCMYIRQIIQDYTNNIGGDLKFGDDLTDEVVGWLAIVAISEVIMTFIMFELKSIITGYRFAVSSSDWFFTAIYII